jgi:hypothetical protein
MRDGLLSELDERLGMRGSDERSGSFFSYVDLAGWVRADHPLRVVREITSEALVELGGDFTNNWDPPLVGEIAANFLRAVLAQLKVKRLVSSDHFSIVGTLIEALVSIKSLRRKDGSDNGPDGPGPGPGRYAECGFKQKKRFNATHRSTTDPECLLYKKADGQSARLCYLRHALMENRHGLVVDGCPTLATPKIYASKAPKRLAFCGTATPQPRVG